MSELFPQNARDEALARIAHALQEACKIEDVEQAKARAESLIAVAESFSVPVEGDGLLQWIYYKSPGKEWSVAEWRRWCEKYTQAVHELNERHASAEAGWQIANCGHCGERLVTASAARAHRCRLICPHCVAFALRLVTDDIWMCENCGQTVCR
jgi:hypothetical protein